MQLIVRAACSAREVCEGLLSVCVCVGGGGGGWIRRLVAQERSIPPPPPSATTTIGGLFGCQ